MTEKTRRTALVTGASRGLGRAIALSLAQEGLDVAVNYVRNAGAAEEVRDACRAAGVRSALVKADVSTDDAARLIVETTAAELGAIDVLVVNAGVGVRESLLDARPDNFDRAIATNLRPAFQLSQAVIPGMMEARWGRLIYLSSIAARTGGVISAAYAASKAGIEGLMHYYATQLLPHGVTANALSPAFIRTEMLEGIALPPPETMPLGRMGEPEEVAEVARMLVRTGFVTGQTIQINAGRYMT